eukprot:TRINITY_DN49312_c0_g1_i1.p1 TRINITY_DN49312_c0_g1~~TRINITY_DN49312_c0_g1_i1.p1  ORF type:complete len:164 (-),score=32.74 TRINITY_DN49312_c0_g1_i1:221-676(-)
MRRQKELFETVEELQNKIEELIMSFQRKNVEVGTWRTQQASLDTIVNTIKDQLNLNSSPLSQEEKVQILKSLIEKDYMMADPRGYEGAGRWFECPNGHPYVIADCGGAMQMSVCPECQAPIGGADHHLTEGNQQSPEMNALLENLDALDTH